MTDTSGTGSIDGAAATDTAAESTDATDGANEGVGLSTQATGSKGKDSAGAAAVTTDSDGTREKRGSFT